MSVKAYAIDYESYYDKEYSLSEMSTYQYVTDPRFDAYLVAVHGEDFHWVGHPKDFDWSVIDGAIWIFHNASFDYVVTTRLQELGIIPPHIKCHSVFDTADMAPYLNAPRNLAGASFALLGRMMSKKVRSDMKGKTYQDIVDEGPEALEALITYGGTDAVNAYDLWKDCHHLWPESEQEISRLNFEAAQYGTMVNKEYAIKTTAAMEKQIEEVLMQIPWVQPSIDFLTAKHGRPITVWEYLSLAKKDQTKNKETKERNVQPPLSPKAVRAMGEKCGIAIPASLAKTSEDWDKCIKQHGPKFPWMAAIGTYRSLNAHYCKARTVRDGLRPDGTFVMSTLYWGGHTGRFSGGSGDESGSRFNPQNPPRDEMFGCNLRHFFVPRPGHKFIIADYSQIEPRKLLWLAGDTKLAEAVKQEGSVYQAYAKIRGIYTGTGKFKDDDPKGYAKVKAQVLGLGYGMGAARYAQTLLDANLVKDELEQGRIFLGVKPKDLPSEVRDLLKYIKQPFNRAPLYFVFLRAQREVNEYRESNPLIVRHWQLHDYWLKKSAVAKDPTHEIALRNGHILKYYDPQMVATADGRSIKARFEIGGALKFLHRGLLTNNEVQSTARFTLTDAWRVLAKEQKVVLWTAHDEFIIESPEHRVEEDQKIVEEIMVTSSPWAEGCPLGVESHITDMYLK